MNRQRSPREKDECRKRPEEKKMDELRLTAPAAEYADDIRSFRQEVLECDTGEDLFAGCLSLDDCASAEEWIELCRLRKAEDTCEQTGVQVPSDTYLAVRIRDNRVVGVIDLRHHIDHPILGTWGGHCGYTVRPSERGKGYAKQMLQLNLQNAEDLGIERFLVTCNEQNAASERVILANGGVYENTLCVDGSNIRRYWITLKNGAAEQADARL